MKYVPPAMASARHVVENAISAVENLPATDDAARYLVEDWLPFAESWLSALKAEEIDEEGQAA